MEKIVNFMRFSEGGYAEIQRAVERPLPSLVPYRGRGIAAPFHSSDEHPESPAVRNRSYSAAGRAPLPAA